MYGNFKYYNWDISENKLNRMVNKEIFNWQYSNLQNTVLIDSNIECGNDCWNLLIHQLRAITYTNCSQIGPETPTLDFV